jgi:hypothetical protein
LGLTTAPTSSLQDSSIIKDVIIVIIEMELVRMMAQPDGIDFAFSLVLSQV